MTIKEIAQLMLKEIDYYLEDTNRMPLGLCSYAHLLLEDHKLNIDEFILFDSYLHRLRHVWHLSAYIYPVGNWSKRRQLLRRIVTKHTRWEAIRELRRKHQNQTLSL